MIDYSLNYKIKINNQFKANLRVKADESAQRLNYKTLITFYCTKSSLFLNILALFGVLFSNITNLNLFSLNYPSKVSLYQVPNKLGRGL